MKYIVTHSCSHEHEYNLTGKHSYRTYRLARLREELCPNCQQRANILAWNQERNLPQLVGTEEQVVFADDIRKQEVERVEEWFSSLSLVVRTPDEQEHYEALIAAHRQLMNEPRASFWLEARQGGYRQRVLNVYHKIQERGGIGSR